ncbi:MAG: carbohydrate-binding family 9-like protein [Oscillospiraceae bacterium]|nr:carbohydrate-binding family 9-like protein [Oscillospiraceae bacterium]
MNDTAKIYIIRCAPLRSPTDELWRELPAVSLSDTVTGAPPRQATEVRSCYDPDARLWYVRFDALDDEIISDFANRDDKLYEQDVFEMFYGDTGESCRYKELEVSPHNVQFDADITFKKLWEIQGDVAWNLVGWVSATAYHEAEKRLVSVWSIPFDSLAVCPAPGVVWPINFYRIDRSSVGDELQAWSPTGLPNFHVPDKFGKILFD